MMLEQVRNILIAVLLMAGVLVVNWLYKPDTTNSVNSLSATTTTIKVVSDVDSDTKYDNTFVPHGEYDAEYNDYIKYLEWRCPVYVPSGNAWKNCLYDLQLAREAEVKTILDNINVELPKTIGRLTKRKETTIAFEEIPGMLKQLNKSWLDYRDKLCELDHQEYAAGSATEGYITECQIFETQKYINLLNDFDKRWNIDYEERLNKIFDELKGE